MPSQYLTFGYFITYLSLNENTRDVGFKVYEYKFERLDLKGIIERTPKVNHHDVIKKHAEDGWRLVQIFAPPTAGYGKAHYFELIFERKKEAQ